MRKFIKTKKGFTLTELIICMAVLSIFTLGAAAVIFPVLNTYLNTQKLADANMLCSSVIDEIRGDISISKNTPTVSDNGFKINFTSKYGETEYFSAENANGSTGQGYLYRTDKKDNITKLVFDKNFYKGKTISVDFANTGANRYSITISVYDGSNIISTHTTTITPLNLL